MARTKHVKLTVEQRLKLARNYLSENDLTAPGFAENHESIVEFVNNLVQANADKKLYQSVVAMLHVHYARNQRQRRSHAHQKTISSSDIDQVHPFSWTQKYWKHQRRLQQSAAMPPPATHPRHQSFRLPGPDGKSIDHAQCRERWNLLRVLQFDLLYMSFVTERSRDFHKARVWQLTQEGSMLKELYDQKVILDLGANWDSIARVTEAIKIQRMEPLGVDLFMFEGYKKYKKSSFKHLEEAEQEKLRDMAQRRLKLRGQDKTDYDRLRGKFLNEMKQYETLVKAFAEDEASYTDRRLATARSKGLRQLAQPLHAPHGVALSDKKAKELLTAAILQENIENERSQLIDDARNWAFASEIDPDIRGKKFFSLDAWWAERGQFRRDSLSSDSDGPHQPPGGGMVLTDQDSPIRERHILGRPIIDPNTNKGNVALGGFGDGPGNPTDYIPAVANRHHSLNESSDDNSNSKRSFEVGSGTLVPPEVLGLSSVGAHGNDNRTDSSTSHNQTSQVNDAQIAEVGKLRGVNDQRDGKVL